MHSKTQFETAISEVCDVVIGFDFGTSCSKVVLRTPFHHGKRAMVVPFGDASHPSSDYLLPSVLWVCERGESVSLVRRDGWQLVRDIKYHLVRDEPVPTAAGSPESQSFDAKVVAVAFLSSAIANARAWFLKTQQQLYGHCRLRWTLNLGLPSEDYADEKLCETYREVSKAAWFLSVLREDLSLTLAEEALQSEAPLADLPEEDCAEVNHIPEVAAEVAGYARSHLREEGLHILVDVGAMTLDVCSFILHERDGEDCYELLTADVRELGASMLYRHRVAAVRQAVDAHMAALIDEYDPVASMPDSSASYVPCPDAVAKSISDHDETHDKACKKALWRTLQVLKTHRDPHSPRWHDTMPLFLTGGGSAMEFYKQRIEKLSTELREFHVDCQGLQALPLTKPKDLQTHIDIEEDLFHRLAVAWGLSYPETDIGEVTRPCDIEDVAPREVYDNGKVFVSKEMV